jgi:hypothetical protein
VDMSMFTGLCVGGPHDGQVMAHEARTKKFYVPVIAWTINMDRSEVRAMEVGEYVYLGEKWKWVEK